MFVYDTETYPDEENGDCILHGIGYQPVSKRYYSMVHRDSTPEEIEKKKKEVLVEESGDFIDKMLKHIYQKRIADAK